MLDTKTKQVRKVYEDFIAISRYARWLEEEARRETWEETVERFCSNVVPGDSIQNVRDAIYNKDVMPSMRAVMSAGEALDRDNVAAYNCCYLPVNSIESFSETMFILMNGTGVGFSVEREETSKLPSVPKEILQIPGIKIIVGDSKEGWADAFEELLTLLYRGIIPDVDYSYLRPKGARLKTFGGRSSGPEPLEKLFKFTIDKFKEAEGRQLRPIEVHDIMCMIGMVVVVGGVRRSAMISLSDLDDEEMREAKSGSWWLENPQRSLANNSAVYQSLNAPKEFIEKEWEALVKSGSGERGIFNRAACDLIVQTLTDGRRKSGYKWGVNPCSEIIMRPYQFCNLSEVVVREDDTEETLIEKIKVAVELGVIQSTYTDFYFLRNIWKETTEEERLLGVSLTGIFDHPTLMYDEQLLQRLKEAAFYYSKVFAKVHNVNISTSVTCVKPSGTVSQLVSSASGMHPRYSAYYLRTVRGSTNDPLTKFLKDSGVPCVPCNINPDETMIFQFPMKAPLGDKAITTTNGRMSAIEHLEIWKRLQLNWCSHKPSVTVSVKQEEWDEVKGYIIGSFQYMSGVSFLPLDTHTYENAPYQELSEEQYNRLLEEFPSNIDFSKLKRYEHEDNTSGSQTFACSGGLCEVVNIGEKA